LIIVDATFGNTIDSLESHINWLVSNYKTEKKVVVLDNFHKLRLIGSGNTKKNETTSDQSQRIKDLVQLNDVHLMMTVELRKLDNTDMKPQIQDLLYSCQLEYDADIVFLVHNEYHAKKRQTMVCWRETVNGETIASPYVEVDLCKNKINGKLDTFAYKLNSSNLQMEEVSYATVEALYAKKTGSRISGGGERF
jgi:replicative DNA helicase